MTLLTLKGRSRFENAVYFRLLAFGAASLCATVLAVYKPSLNEAFAFLFGTFGRALGAASEAPQALIATTVGLAWLYVHHLYWSTSTWEKQDEYGEPRVCVSKNTRYESWKNKLTVVGLAALAFCSFSLARHSLNVSWAVTFIGGIAIVFLGVVTRHIGTMSEWVANRESCDYVGWAHFVASALSGVAVFFGVLRGFLEFAHVRTGPAFLMALAAAIVWTVIVAMSIYVFRLPAINPAIEGPLLPGEEK